MSKRTKSERRKDSEQRDVQKQSKFLSYLPHLFTFLAFAFGFYQYFDSQVQSDIRRFRQTYFDEKLGLYKNLSSSVSEVMVDMQMTDTRQFKVSYKKFKSYYWSIQLVKDISYDSLLASIHDFDYLVKNFDRDKDAVRRENYRNATRVVQKINNQLNKLILNELDRINTSSSLIN
jgi:hypothetical protein